MTTSVTSGGVGTDQPSDRDGVLAEKERIEYFADRRGYISMKLDHDQLRNGQCPRLD